MEKKALEDLKKKSGIDPKMSLPVARPAISSDKDSRKSSIKDSSDHN